MTAKKTSKKTTANLDTRNVLLAALGLYGKAYEQGSAQATEMNRKGGVFFKELVSRGEKLEKQAQGKLKELKSANPAITERIEDLRGNFDKLKETLGRQTQTVKAKAA